MLGLSVYWATLFYLFPKDWGLPLDIGCFRQDFSKLPIHLDIEIRYLSFQKRVASVKFVLSISF